MAKPRGRGKRRKQPNRHQFFSPGLRITPPAHPYLVERNPWRRSIVRADINADGNAHYLNVAAITNTLIGNGEISDQLRSNFNMKLIKIEVWSMVDKTLMATNVNMDVYSVVPSAVDLAAPPAGVGTIFYGVLSRLVDFGNVSQPARVGWVYGPQHQAQIIPSSSELLLCAIAATPGSTCHAYVTIWWNLASVAPPLTSF